jgi:hypothetical protein
MAICPQCNRYIKTLNEVKEHSFTYQNIYGSVDSYKYTYSLTSRWVPCISSINLTHSNSTQRWESWSQQTGKRITNAILNDTPMVKPGCWYGNTVASGGIALLTTIFGSSLLALSIKFWKG